MGDIIRFGSVGLLITEIQGGASARSLTKGDIADLTHSLLASEDDVDHFDSSGDTDEEVAQNTAEEGL